MDEYSRYDLSDIDPYLIPGSTCLKNLLNFTNTADLNGAEQEITKATLADLANDPEYPSFNLEHLQRIHRRIFSDIYPFAGQIRQVEIGKGGALFLPYRHILSESERCFDQLHNEGLLVGLDPKAFGVRAGYFLGWINRIHPFREGNGRAQRVLIDQLAAARGFAIEWNSMSSDAMALASREARTSDYEATRLGRLISINTVEIQ